jgi:hypothetical protein
MPTYLPSYRGSSLPEPQLFLGLTAFLLWILHPSETHITGLNSINLIWKLNKPFEFGTRFKKWEISCLNLVPRTYFWNTLSTLRQQLLVVSWMLYIVVQTSKFDFFSTQTTMSVLRTQNSNNFSASVFRKLVCSTQAANVWGGSVQITDNILWSLACVN